MQVICEESGQLYGKSNKVCISSAYQCHHANGVLLKKIFVTEDLSLLISEKAAVYDAAVSSCTCSHPSPS